MNKKVFVSVPGVEKKYYLSQSLSLRRILNALTLVNCLSGTISGTLNPTSVS